MHLWNNNKPIPVPVVCPNCSQQVTCMMDIQVSQTGETNLIGDCPNCQEVISTLDTNRKESSLICKVSWVSEDMNIKIEYLNHTPIEICLDVIESACKLSYDGFITHELIKELLSRYSEEGLKDIETYIKEVRKANAIK